MKPGGKMKGGARIENGKGEIKTEYEEMLKIMEIEIKKQFYTEENGKEKKS